MARAPGAQPPRVVSVEVIGRDTFLAEVTCPGRRPDLGTIRFAIGPDRFDGRMVVAPWTSAPIGEVEHPNGAEIAAVSAAITPAMREEAAELGDYVVTTAAATTGPRRRRRR